MATNSDGSTVSLWQSTQKVPDFSPLDANASADVCIVGAGIAGLTTAYLLTKAGRKVIVLDDGPITSGETERTTAHLSNEIDDRYMEIVRIHGNDGAQKAAQSHTAAIKMIESIVQDEDIDCDFERVSGYLFTPDDDQKMLEKEMDAAHEAGLTDVELLEKAPLLSFNTNHCLHFPNQAQFHPTKYLSAVAKAIVRDGGRICAHTRVTEIEEDDSPFTIKTKNGHDVTAADLVVATNAPINDNAMIYSKQIPYRTFVIALRVPKGYVAPGLYWDTLDPYHYVRLQQDPKREDTEMLIVGGEDHRTGKANDMNERFDRLEAWARERFPAATDIGFRWSGQVMETIDGLALIGRKPGGHERSYIVTGDSGMGMTHGTIAGMLLTDLIAHRENEWIDLYDPSRMRIKASMEFAKENTGTAKHMIGGHVRKGDVESETDIKAGHGGIFSEDGKHIALYLDSQGNAHRFSAVCPHKGCIVSWNDGEKSWDCPCHGSRFTALGEAVNGPTIADLKSADE